MRRREAGWLAGLALGIGVAAAGWFFGLERVVLRAGPNEASLWVAEDGFYLWVEASNPALPWYTALTAEPLVEVERYGRTERFLAEAMPGEIRRVERLYRRKYGMAHALLALVTDRTHAIPVRLARLPDRGTRA
jgi:hypothetical protein